jgi:iron complex transport system substrate-binding protein
VGTTVVTRAARGTGGTGPGAGTGLHAPGRPSPGDELGRSTLDPAALAGLGPELVIVRDGGYGPNSSQVEAALVVMETSPQIVALDPITLEGIFHSITTVGAMTESEDDAIDLLETLREDIGEIEQGVVARHDAGLRPKRVAVLEGLSPLLSSGRWVPEQVRRAGGWEVLGREGEQAAPTTWEAIRDVDPEMLFFAQAGLTLLETQKLWRSMPRPEFWEDLEAVRRGQVFFLEPVYFSRPGPRVVDGVGMLAEIFDPDGFVGTSPDLSWTPLVE